MQLFWPLLSEDQHKQDHKVLWSHFYVPKHESSTPGPGCRLLYNGIYRIYSCISRPPIFKVKNRISHHFAGKQIKFTPTEISQNVNFFFLRMH